MHLNLYITLLVFFLLLAGTIVSFAQDEQKIKSISVYCHYAVPTPEPVMEKLNATLEKTLERILIENESRSIDSFIQSKSEIESSIVNGLNIVFEPKGYQVESLDIDFAETTKANFKIKPFSAYVKNVDIQLDVGNFHQFWTSRFNKTFEQSRIDLKIYYEPLLIGLPVGAEDSDWAFSFVKAEVNSTDKVANLFPNMAIELTVNIAENASITIKPVPSGTLVKTLRVRATSRSLFQMSLDPMKELITSHSNMVVGMPIALVKDTHAEIEREFSKLVDEDTLARKFHAESECRMYFLETDPLAVYLQMRTESKMYHLKAEAVIDIGNDEAPTEFECHAGTIIGNNFEIFANLNFFPDDVRFRPDVGFGLHPFKSSFVAAGWDINANTWKLFIEQYVTTNVYIDVEVFESDEGQDQYGIIYKPFQFVSFGILHDGENDYWLRASFAF